MWDDEFGQVQTTQKIPTNCCNYEMTMAYLREYAKELGKEVRTEFGKQFGVELSSNKLEKTMKKLEMEKNKSYWLMISLVLI